MTKLVEVQDDYPVAEVQAPVTFSRSIATWLTFAESGIKYRELPRPTLWHVLVMPRQPRKVSEGGILIPAQAQDVEQYQNYIGEIVAMGPLAGKNDKFLNPDYVSWLDCLRRSTSTAELKEVGLQKPKHRWLYAPKVGDWVIYGKYAGMAKTFKGTRFLTINDDDITDVIDSPAGFEITL